MYTSHSNALCGVTAPGFVSTIPRSTASFSIPRSSTPALSPAWAESKSFLNISTPVTVEVCFVSEIPTISTGSPTLIWPRSTRPVTTVPRPVIENTSSTGIRNGLSTARSGVGM